MPGELLTALGYVVGLLVYVAAVRRTDGDGRVDERRYFIGLAALAGGVVGARLAAWLLVSPELLAAEPLGLLDPRYGGRTILGGLVGGWLAVEAAKRYLGIRRRTGDAFALALPAGEAVGRLGCHLKGCCHGLPWSGPGAVWQHDAWRHPTQLYAAALALATLTVLWALRDRMRREGDLFRVYLVLAGLGRFGLEFLRAGERAGGGLTMAQQVSLVLIAIGAASLAASWRFGTKETEDDEPELEAR